MHIQSIMVMALVAVVSSKAWRYHYYRDNADVSGKARRYPSYREYVDVSAEVLKHPSYRDYADDVKISPANSMHDVEALDSWTDGFADADDEADYGELDDPLSFGADDPAAVDPAVDEDTIVEPDNGAVNGEFEDWPLAAADAPAAVDPAVVDPAVVEDTPFVEADNGAVNGELEDAPLSAADAPAAVGPAVVEDTIVEADNGAVNGEFEDWPLAAADAPAAVDPAVVDPVVVVDTPFVEADNGAVNGEPEDAPLAAADADACNVEVKIMVYTISVTADLLQSFFGDNGFVRDCGIKIGEEDDASVVLATMDSILALLVGGSLDGKEILGKKTSVDFCQRPTSKRRVVEEDEPSHNIYAIDVTKTTLDALFGNNGIIEQCMIPIINCEGVNVVVTISTSSAAEAIRSNNGNDLFGESARAQSCSAQPDEDGDEDGDGHVHVPGQPPQMWVYSTLQSMSEYIKHQSEETHVQLIGKKK